MVHELTYTTISAVIESWEQVKRTKDYEKVAGSKLFQKLFDVCPGAKPLFGFPLDVKGEDLLKSKRFLAHAAYLLEMLDTALNLLGPDIELLTEIMTELGTKHIHYGVTKDMFPHMGVALLYMLKEILKDGFNDGLKAHWVEVYQALSGDMTQGLVNAGK